MLGESEVRANTNSDFRNPKITFAIIAFNQEKYIGPAVEAAFAQTYSPMEIVLSDDCSSDGTYEVMESLAASYSGPHDIKLNRNRQNLGIGGHVSRIFEIAQGELIVLAAGDDISLSERCDEIVTVWRQHGYCDGSIFAGTTEVDESLNVLGERIPVPWKEASLCSIIKRMDIVVGASHAVTASVMKYFGALESGIVNEDGAIALRSALIGRLICLPKPLVMHRIHELNTGSSGLKDVSTAKDRSHWWNREFDRKICLFQGMLIDAARIEKSEFHEKGIRELTKLLRCEIAYMQNSKRAIGALPRLLLAVRFPAKAIRNPKLFLQIHFPSIYGHLKALMRMR